MRAKRSIGERLESLRILLLVSTCMATTASAIAGSVTNTYDSLGRLITATHSNGVVITYVYDATGNRTSYVVTGAPS